MIILCKNRALNYF